MSRTTQGAVQDLLGSDYDSRRVRQLKFFIRTANSITTRLVQYASDAGTSLSSDDAEIVETWLGAYVYTLSDRIYTSRSTQGASGSFFIDEENPYWQGAKLADPSGMLEEMLASETAVGVWLGKTLTEREDYEDRN